MNVTRLRDELYHVYLSRVKKESIFEYKRRCGMKVTYNWLKDFLNIKIPANKLAEGLTMAGLEVTALEKINSDFVFEFEITSNRPDLLSVIGIARETAALLGSKFKSQAANYPRKSITAKQKRHKHEYNQLAINVQSKSDCSLYTARIIQGVRVGPSPNWLKNRLELVGLRSVNNIVDITNYILLETGQPLHAFDLAKLKGRSISVRRAKDSESIVTIDGQKQALSKQTLVIADKVGPVAIAGIMGGQDSQVDQTTKDILLEAAVFDPIITRRASRIFGLSSESSYRFERGIDWQGLDFASLRATDLILSIAGGRLALSKATTKPKPKHKTIVLKAKQINLVLGRTYTDQEIKRSLTHLGFAIKKINNKDFKINIPSFRIDVHQPVDLIEEIARISGYGNIPMRLPKITPRLGIPISFSSRRSIKDILVSQGINEVITYSLLNSSLVDQFGYSQGQLVAIANPLTNQQEILRPSIMPGLISCIGYNLNQKQKDIRIFEIGNIFRTNKEQSSLGLAYSSDEFNLLHIKGVLELLLERLGILGSEFLTAQSAHPYFQKEISLSLMVNKKSVGNLGMIKPVILERLDIKTSIFAAELDLQILINELIKLKKRYKPIPLYPEVMRDISVVLKQDIPAGAVIKTIMHNAIPFLLKINVKDYYFGKQIPTGHKGLTLSCVYQADDHTLTAQEIDAAHQKVSRILKTDFSAQQR